MCAVQLPLAKVLFFFIYVYILACLSRQALQEFCVRTPEARGGNQVSLPLPTLSFKTWALSAGLTGNEPVGSTSRLPQSTLLQ